MNKDKLNIISETLQEIDENSVVDGISNHFLKLRNINDEIVIDANEEGLIFLAQQLVALALDGKDGSHIHLDESSMMDECDKALVIVKKTNAWS